MKVRKPREGRGLHKREPLVAEAWVRSLAHNTWSARYEAEAHVAVGIVSVGVDENDALPRAQLDLSTNNREHQRR